MTFFKSSNKKKNVNFVENEKKTLKDSNFWKRLKTREIHHKKKKKISKKAEIIFEHDTSKNSLKNKKEYKMLFFFEEKKINFWKTKKTNLKMAVLKSCKRKNVNL